MHSVITNGANTPALGLGTFRMDQAEVAEALPKALQLAFRHVDTTQFYDNDAAVGAAIAGTGVPRHDIFLTTKVWVTNFAPDALLPAVEESLRKLGTDHVDLLLLHWREGSDTPREVQIEQLNLARERGMNLAIFDFELPAQEMAAIHALARPDGRIVNPEELAPQWD